MTKREAARYPCDWTGGMLLAIVFLMEWEGVNAPVSCSASTAKLCSIHILRILLLSNLNLAHFHSLESILVAFRRHAGAEGGRDADRKFREKGLQQQGVGNDADVCADTNELCGFQPFRAVPYSRRSACQRQERSFSPAAFPAPGPAPSRLCL